MNFNSLEYALFLPICIIIYHVLPRRVRNPVLLIFSFYFYMSWEPVYALLMLISIVITYLSGVLTEDLPGLKRLWLSLSFILNLSILFFFKYFNFAADVVRDAAALFGFGIGEISLNVLLPVGISFYTFQALSYSADIYYGRIKTERNFITYALYVSFFPQLVAGPIERSDNIIPQLKSRSNATAGDFRAGVQYLLWGLFKKLVIADRLAVLVNTVYAAPESAGSFQLALAAVCFAFQIYCDFSAYSDIAKGSARFLGIKLMTNFDSPFCSKTTGELWQRWHISLSSWFRDYLYIPLGGNRISKGRTYLNVLIVTFLSGLWHGAALTYVAWGIVNGLYQVIGKATKTARAKIRGALRIRPEARLYRLWQMAFVFVLFTLSFVFFRADSIGDALLILSKILNFNELAGSFAFSTEGLGLVKWEIIAAAVSTSVLIVHDLLCLRGNVDEAVIEGSAVRRYAVWFLLLSSIVIFGSYGPAYDPQDFIYFQF